jgi:hypothetical protein
MSPAASNAAQTLRKLYATPWNPWTLVEAMDNELGQRFKCTASTKMGLLGQKVKGHIHDTETAGFGLRS